MFQPTHNNVIFQNIFLSSIECLLPAVLAKALRTAEKPRHNVMFASLAFPLETLLNRVVKFYVFDRLLYSWGESVLAVHISVMWNIPFHWVADLIDVSVISLNSQIVPEVKMRIEKNLSLSVFGYLFNNHWVRLVHPFVVKIFSCVWKHQKLRLSCELD